VKSVRARFGGFRRHPLRHSKIASDMILMIDNYDSFTWNLVQYFGELGEDVRVVRNDDMTLAALRKLEPKSIVVSPGPCTPSEAGVSLEVVEKLAGTVPILGVCLGHQTIGQAFGGKIVRAREIMHGKTSMIHHDGKGVFRGLPNPFEATRYHSLVVEKSSLPACLEVSAWTVDRDGYRDEIMGLRHRTLAVEGVQFHPESILTQHGHAMLRNFLDAYEAETKD
jgi:anthranilate synthase component 2